MRPVFPRIYNSIRKTLDYFNIGRIRDHIFRFAGKPNLDYLDTYYDVTLRWHQYMEEEINQNIYGSNKNVQVAMFEHLKNWLDNDWRLNPGYENTIESLVDDYNETTWIGYENAIKEDEEKYKQTGIYEKKHLESYGIEYKARQSMFGHDRPAYKETIINKWFYCNEKKPELIDKSYLPQYYAMVNEIVDSFKRCSLPYVERYNSGKIVSSADIIIEKQVLSEQKETKLLTDKEPQPLKKLKVNLSVPQLAYLFKLLLDFDLIQNATKAELKRFIIANFSTKMADEISDSSLANKLSETEKAEANFWADKLIDMHKAAKKV